MSWNFKYKTTQYNRAGAGERPTFGQKGNTYQTYMWIENNSTIQNKVDENATYLSQQQTDTYDFKY